MRVFGVLRREIPRELSGIFSIVGVGTYCDRAILTAFNELACNRRVETLTLIVPDLDGLGDCAMLREIADYGCKIYFYTESFSDECARLADFGIVICGIP